MLVILLKNMYVKHIHQSYIAWYILSNQLVIYHLHNADSGFIHLFMVYLTMLSIVLEYMA